MHLRAVRTAAEIALLVAALVILGFISSTQLRPRLWESGAADQCVSLGRAGSYCDARDGKTPVGPKQNCQFLGRAGRFCPDAGR